MKTYFGLTAAIALAIAGNVDAASRYNARVVSSSPIVDRVVQEEEYCWERGRDKGREGAVLGALVGGALGNQVGKGDGRKAATVAGVVAGAVIGRNIDRRDRDRYTCESRPSYRDQIIGYDVTYRFRGRTYHGQVPYRPGRSIPVVVYDDNRRRGSYEVEPADRLM